MPSALSVVGGSIASLALSLVASRRGRQVELYLDPARLGGSFSGIVAGQRRFDLGCRLFELAYEGSGARSIATFDPQRDHHRPFIAEVASFIKDILKDELRPAATPEMWINGRKTRCALMTVDLSDLPSALTSADRTLVCEQSQHILNEAPTPVLADQTLCQASIAQHGPRLHALLIQAICAKQYAGWIDVLASERRKLWAALFHTRTVYEAFAGLPITFHPNRPFSTTASGQAHPFVTRLYQAVQASPGITIIPTGLLTGLAFDPRGETHLGFGPGSNFQVRSEECVLGLPPEQLFAAAGAAYAPERIKSSVAWVDVAECDTLNVPSSLMICDADLAVLRISGAGRTEGWQSFGIEFGSAPPDLSIAIAALQKTGLIVERATVRLAHQVSGPAQCAPIPANQFKFETASTSLGSFSGVLLGGARRFGFEGLNDQLADALYYGETLC